ncbi:MAG TPA: VCBS repeat-containing protein [Anaeromyxobacteraceae bacterium]|nr:VCBS repeat-containing protein [Anaeromyxobacteraceae bacterium]
MTTNVLSKYGLPALAAVLAVACAGGGEARGPRSGGRAEPPPGTELPARAPGVIARAVDADGDGRPETWRLVAPDGRLAGTEHDGNGDGRVDRWVRVGGDGLPEQVAVDLDFDGRADVTRWYQAGRVVRSEEAIPGLPRKAAP